MSKKEKEQAKEEEIKQQEAQVETENGADSTEAEAQTAEAEEQETKEETPDDKIAALQAELDKAKKEYLFLMAEFDNYRKRTLKEKADLIKNGGEKAMLDLLPVVDDFERAIDAIDKSDDVESLKDGVSLIYNKFLKYLESQQVKPMESTGNDFDADIYGKPIALQFIKFLRLEFKLGSIEELRAQLTRDRATSRTVLARWQSAQKAQKSQSI